MAQIIHRCRRFVQRSASVRLVFLDLSPILTNRDIDLELNTKLRVDILHRLAQDAAYLLGMSTRALNHNAIVDLHHLPTDRLAIAVG